MLCESFCIIYIIVQKHPKRIVRINLKAIKSFKNNVGRTAEHKIYPTVITNIIYYYTIYIIVYRPKEY